MLMHLGNIFGSVENQPTRSLYIIPAKGFRLKGRLWPKDYYFTLMT